MQKTPIYQFSRTALALMAVASSLPAVVTVATAGEGGGGLSGLAQREMIRRQDSVSQADILLNEGRAAYAKEDYQQAVDKYKQALDRLPDAPMVSDRRQSYIGHLSDASVALAQHHRKVGKYAEARSLLEGVLTLDPSNIDAKRESGYLDDPIRTNPALTYEHTQNVDKVRRGLYTAEGNVNLGKFNEAEREYENVIRLDSYNSAARRGLEQVAAAKSDYYRAAYDHTRAKLLGQVDAAWESAVPAEAPAFDPNVIGPSRDLEGVAKINQKLQDIIIPIVNFEDSTVEEAVEFLRGRAFDLDTTEVDIAKKGVNFLVRRKTGGASAEVAVSGTAGTDGVPVAAADGKLLKIKSMNLKNQPLGQILKYICEVTKLRIKVDSYTVMLVPASEAGDDVFSRQFRVPPDFHSSLDAGGEQTPAASTDPFAETKSASTVTLKTRRPIIELLKLSGIAFGEGASATLNSSGSLMVTNTSSELDKVEQLVQSTNKAPKQVKISTKFVEISQENNDELGFDWVVNPFGIAQKLYAGGGTTGNQGGRNGGDFIRTVKGVTVDGIPASSSQASQNGVSNGLRSGDQAINRNSIDAILNNPSRTAQQANVAPGIAALTGLFSDGQVQLIMRGLAQKKGVDLMTAPSITAKSGQQAKIEIVREFIYPTEYEPPQLPQTTGSSFGGGSSLFGGGGGGGGSFPVTPATPSAFTTRNTGVTLAVLPTFADNDFVIDLQFTPEIIEFEGFINYGSPIQTSGTDALGNPVTNVLTENRIEQPVFSARRVSTQLSIYDGYTVAVGGLMREDVQNVEDKVPILGDIPIIGRLFQSKSENRIKSNLIIFVTAQIIDATGRPLRGPDSANPSVTTPISTDGVGMLPPLSDVPTP
jgi:general secretion pathway protein D